MTRFAKSAPTRVICSRDFLLQRFQIDFNTSILALDAVALTMKVAIRKAGGPFGTRTSLGAYAAVAVAVGKLTRKLHWRSPRRADFQAEDGQKVKVTLLMFQKGTNDFATDVWSRLTAAGLGSDLAIDVCNEILLPSQKVEELWLEGVTDPPSDVIGWAIKHGWQVEEEPGPGRFWNSM